MNLRVMVVDDDALSGLSLTRQLTGAGYEAVSCRTPFAVLKALDEGIWDVVLTDLCMPVMDGMQLLEAVKTSNPATAVILMTAHASIETAIQAIQSGATDYLSKPVNLAELQLRLQRIAQNQHLARELAGLRKALGAAQEFSGLVGTSTAMRQVFSLIEQFADNPSNVLITGATGTGKELVARALHQRSARAANPFVAVACGAVPRDLAESMLFGHEAGSFTGASKQHRGRVEMACGGTLFLDDVDDLPLEIQVKLLRVIQERTFERVGGERSLTADVRLIAATKVDLEDAEQQGRFRQDLYYRLKVLNIVLPPLRTRPEDIQPLSAQFLRILAEERKQPLLRLAPATLERLLGYAWPGNVRELRHALESALAVADGPEILPRHLPANFQSAARVPLYTLNLETQTQLDFEDFMRGIERDVLFWALKKSDGNQGKAGELLGLPRTTLRSKLELCAPKDVVQTAEVVNP